MSQLAGLTHSDALSHTLLHLMQDFEASPAALRLITSASNVALANPEAQVFSAMIDGWRNQQLSRGLREQTIRNRTATVTRFRDGQVPGSGVATL